MKSYFWLLFHPLKVWKKRRFVQSQRKIGDGDIFRYMSYKLFEEENINSRVFRAVLRLLNRISYYYCRLVGIKTIEMWDDRW